MRAFRLSRSLAVRHFADRSPAHYLAWTHGIHHQDPSLTNVMYRNRRDGKNCPVLNDWDLANDRDLAIDATVPQTHTGLTRTGTMPFMAIARLDAGAWDGHLQHIYRHDLEAFFYILASVVCCYKDGRRLDSLPPMLETWTKGDTWTKYDPETCSAYKFKFICNVQWPSDSFPTDSWSYEMAALVNSIRAFFADMFRLSAPSEQAYDDTFKLQLERHGRALPPPKEDDKPTEIWEGFCGAVQEELLTMSDWDTLKKEDLPPRLASFLPDSETNTSL